MPTILDSFKLDNKTAFVTGAGRGIGKACAITLAEAGADVAAVDIDGETAEKTAKQIEALGRKALFIECNVTDSASVNAMVAEVVNRLGKIDIAFNNAGISINAKAEEMTDQQWLDVINVDLNAIFYCARAAGKMMIERGGGGRIINTASMSGQIVNRPQCQCAYNSAKAGVIQLTKSLAAEWASRGINVNSISPGYTGTEMTMKGKEFHDLWNRDTPMGRLAKVEEICGAVVFLASSAADYITGHDLVIDGGFTCW